MSAIGKGMLDLSLFGESHGTAIGAVIEGFPAGTAFDEAFAVKEMARRKSGSAVYSTSRGETDAFEVLSGIYNGYTEGTPIAVIIRNADVKRSDYNEGVLRPSHADYTSSIRYKGYADRSGGGHSSGRLTAPLVFMGALAKMYLKARCIAVYAHISSIGAISDAGFEGAAEEALKAVAEKSFPVIDDVKCAEMLGYIASARAKGDSVGGEIACTVRGLQAGLGSPIFFGAESVFSSLLYSIPAVKSVSFGAVAAFASMTGSKANDPYRIMRGAVVTETNNNGGILGGITGGMSVDFNVTIKPTPSIALPQRTVDMKTGENVVAEIKGRHDACIVPRAVPVIEAAAALASMELLLEAYGYHGN